MKVCSCIDSCSLSVNCLPEPAPDHQHFSMVFLRFTSGINGKSGKSMT